MSNDLLDMLNGAMDHLEPGVAKVAKALSHVHVDGEPDTRVQDPDTHGAIDAEFTERPIARPAGFQLGSQLGSDGRGPIWHVYPLTDTTPLCSEQSLAPDSILHPSKVQGAIIVCVSCMRQLMEKIP